MTAPSRPLRALGLVLGGWIAVRVIALWQVDGAAVLPLANIRQVPIVASIAAAPFDQAIPLQAAHRRETVVFPSLNEPHRERVSVLSPQLQRPAVRQTILLEQAQQHDSVVRSDTRGMLAANMQPVAHGFPFPSTHNRFSGSAWSLFRNESAPSLASGGQLGGSQIGIRLFYTPGPEALALTARLSAPLSQRTGREAAIGVALRGRNIGVIAEQRIAVDKSGRNSPAVFAYGGVYNVNLPGHLTLDGYAQTGVVGFKSPAAFVDGAVRVERVVVKAEKSSLAIGAGLWGGAQPGVSRIDIGPQVVARTAVAETTLRVSVEWRQRIAGNAAPPSGPSVSVGFDF